MKPKPLLVYISSHEIPPPILNDLRAYEIRQIARRFYSPNAAVEAIALTCADRPPLVIAAVLPQSWVVPFMRLCRERWVTPGVTIIRVCMHDDTFLGRYKRRALTKDGRLKETDWLPPGSDADNAMQARHREWRNSQLALEARLDDLLGGNDDRT